MSSDTDSVKGSIYHNISRVSGVIPRINKIYKIMMKNIKVRTPKYIIIFNYLFIWCVMYYDIVPNSLTNIEIIFSTKT